MLSDRCLSVCLSVYLPCLSRLLCWRIVVKRLVGLMPLDMEVGLGPGHIVLDGDPAPPLESGTVAPIFWPTLLWHSRPSQQLLSSYYIILSVMC